VPYPVDYIVRAGRAVVLPVLSDTYERFNERRSESRIERRDESVRRFQDIVRTLDYLETRSDIDKQRIAYLGYSLGAVFAPIVLALEPRFKVGILQSGGFGGYFYSDALPEDDPVNFAPRVHIPILMVNGRSTTRFL